MNFEFIKSLFDDVDTCLEKSFIQLDAWDVDRLDELKDLIRYIDENNLFKTFNDLSFRINEKTGEKLNNYGSVPFLKSARDILGGDKIPIYINRLSFTDYICLEGLLFLLYLNLYTHSNIDSVPDLEKICQISDFIIYLTVFADDFENNIHNSSVKFNKTLRKMKMVKWDSEDVNKLDKNIMSTLYFVSIKSGSSDKFYKTILFSAVYLMACSAVKYNRQVTCEDVVIGYLLALKFLTEDYSHYILDLYDDEKA